MGNLVRNGSFELGRITYWNVNDSQGHSAQGVSVPYSGKFSAELQDSDSNSVAVLSQELTNHEDISDLQGQTYDFKVLVEDIDYGGDVVATVDDGVNQSQVTITPEQIHYTAGHTTHTVDSSASQLKIEIKGTNASNTGKIRIDGVLFGKPEKVTGNLLINPGFETGNFGTFWNHEQNGSADIKQDLANTGKYSLQATDVGSGTNFKVFQNIRNSEVLAGLIGETVEAYTYHYKENVDNFRLELTAFNGSNRVFRERKKFSLDTQWQKASVSDSIPSAISRLKIKLISGSGTDAKGSIHYDDLFLGIPETLSADFELTPEDPVKRQIIEFSANKTNGHSTEFNWEATNTATGNVEWTDQGKRIANSFNNSAQYDLKLTVKDPEGNTDSVIKTIDVKDRTPIPDTSSPDVLHLTSQDQPGGLQQYLDDRRDKQTDITKVVLDPGTWEINTDDVLYIGDGIFNNVRIFGNTDTVGEVVVKSMESSVTHLPGGRSVDDEFAIKTQFPNNEPIKFYRIEFEASSQSNDIELGQVNESGFPPQHRFEGCIFSNFNSIVDTEIDEMNRHWFISCTLKPNSSTAMNVEPTLGWIGVYYCIIDGNSLTADSGGNGSRNSYVGNYSLFSHENFTMNIIEDGKIDFNYFAPGGELDTNPTELSNQSIKSTIGANFQDIAVVESAVEGQSGSLVLDSYEFSKTPPVRGENVKLNWAVKNTSSSELNSFAGVKIDGKTVDSSFFQLGPNKIASVGTNFTVPDANSFDLNILSTTDTISTAEPSVPTNGEKLLDTILEGTVPEGSTLENLTTSPITFLDDVLESQEKQPITQEFAQKYKRTLKAELNMNNIRIFVEENLASS